MSVYYQLICDRYHTRPWEWKLEYNDYHQACNYVHDKCTRDNGDPKERHFC